MPTAVAILRDLHRLRTHAKNLQDDIARLPKQLQVQQNKVKAKETALKDTQDKITKLKLLVKEKEGKLKDTHQNITKYQKQLETVATAKEMDALKVEIKHGQEIAQKTEDEVLATMEEIEQLNGQLPELNQAVQQAKGELANFDQIQKERRTGLEGELKQTQARLQEVEGGLVEDVKVQYVRLVAGRGEDALSGVQGRTCVACYTEITAQMFNELLRGAFVLCKNCGRILYPAE
ncbi:MAG: hypothetical protein JNM56_00110 [Planctomycetia bacterium]|nr:hypothetical protein [Planctomycetia bacterium]